MAWDVLFGEFPNGIDKQGNILHRMDWASTPPSMEIFGEGGDDYLFSFAASDHISGGSGNDVILGTVGVLHSDNDEDLTVYPNAEIMGDTLEGGPGNDWVAGGGGADRISGNEDDDILMGADGSDDIFGDTGNDVLLGGSHNDTMVGGAGDDALYGDGWFYGYYGLGLKYSVSYIYDDRGFPIAINPHNFQIKTEEDDNDVVAGDDTLDGGEDHEWWNLPISRIVWSRRRRRRWMFM